MVSSGLYRSVVTKGENMSMGYVGDDGHARAREALKHFVRDWSEDGRGERCQAFRPVLDALRRLKPGRSTGGEGREFWFLEPGAGDLLGRFRNSVFLFIVCIPS